MSGSVIGIIGAGIGGLTAALGLLRAGKRVRVFEQAPELGEVGAGLSISPNASLGLGYLGLLDFMEAHADIPQWQYTYHGHTNEVLVEIDRRNVRDQYQAAYYQIHRADFHNELVKRVTALDPDCIMLDQQLAEISKADEGFTLEFSSGRTEQVDVLVGADGLKSNVRKTLFSDDPPTFTGYVAWRTLIPSSDLPDWYSEPASRVWIGDGQNCVSYPVRKGELVNLVAFTRAENWVEEGWSVRAEPEELIQSYSGWHERPARLLEQARGLPMNRWGLFARTPLKTLVNGDAVLLGDAGHPMLPWFGQGASSAIEDGVVLARCFEAHDGPKEALASYNLMRLERVMMLQGESNLGGERLNALDPYTLKNQPLRNEDALGIFRYNPADVAVA